MDKSKVTAIGLVITLGLFLTAGCIGTEQNKSLNDTQEEVEQEQFKDFSNKSTQDASMAKEDAQNCSQAITEKGEELGTPNEEICGDICSEWKGSEVKILQEAENNDLENVYQVCISGKPQWIV